MKNLRREVRLYKESLGRGSSRKPSEVATACEKLLPDIEDIFNKVRTGNEERTTGCIREESMYCTYDSWDTCSDSW